jgi:hypothetical protein
MARRTASLARVGEDLPPPDRAARPGRRKISAPAVEQFPLCFDGQRLRGHFDVELDLAVMESIGCAFAVAMGAVRVIVGHDGTSAAMALAGRISAGIIMQGADVEDVGATTIDELRFAILRRRASGGIYVAVEDIASTAHEICCLGPDSQPVDINGDLVPIARLAERNAFMPAIQIGARIDTAASTRHAFAEALMELARIRRGPPCRLVMNRNIMPAATLFQALEQSGFLNAVGIEIVDWPTLTPLPGGRLADGNPNIRAQISEAVRQHEADMGVFWFSGIRAPLIADKQGNIVAHTNLMLALADRYMNSIPENFIVYDPRCAWRLGNIPEGGNARAIPAYPHDDDVRHIMRSRRAAFGFQLPDRYFHAGFDSMESAVLSIFHLAKLITPEQSLTDLAMNVDRANVKSFSDIVFFDDAKAALDRLCKALASRCQFVFKPMAITVFSQDWRAVLCILHGNASVEISIESKSTEPETVLHELRRHMVL